METGKDAATKYKHNIRRKEKKETELDVELKDDPEARKVKRWRHQLQNAFLTGHPKPYLMPVTHVLFTAIEQHEDIPVKYLQFSKIGKVLRLIVALDDEKLPLDDMYHFRSRAKALAKRFKTISNASIAPDADGKVGDMGKGGIAEGTSTADAAALPQEGNRGSDVEIKGNDARENGINGTADESMTLAEADISMSEVPVPEPLLAMQSQPLLHLKNAFGSLSLQAS